MNSPDALVILNWKQRIESVSGLKCIHLEDVLSKDCFCLKELEHAQDEDKWYFKGLVEEIKLLV